MDRFKKILVFLSIFWSIEFGVCVKILHLSVPNVADLQDDITLDCAYDMGGEELNSVKWYKDEEEFFRFIPRGGGVLSFPVNGANPIETEALCNTKHCAVTLTNLSRQSAGAYRCEVSTEAPTFRVAFETANMTIVAFPRGAVSIFTSRREYSEGEEIRVNCTSPPSDPPSHVRWLINDRQLNPHAIVAVSDSMADDRGLVSRSVSARIMATRELFMRHTGLLELRCEVMAPPINPPIRPTPTPLTATVYMTLLELRGQKFDWLSSSGSSIYFAPFEISFCTYIIFVLSLRIW